MFYCNLFQSFLEILILEGYFYEAPDLCKMSVTLSFEMFLPLAKVTPHYS